MDIKQPLARLTESRAGTMMMWVVTIAALYFARDVLVPLALAVLISFLLAPMATRLERLHFGRVLSAVVVLLTVLGIVGGIGYVVANQFIDLADKLPEYKQTLTHKVRSLRPAGNGTFGKAREALQDLSREVSGDETSGTASTTTDTTTSSSVRQSSVDSLGVATGSTSSTQNLSSHTKSSQPPAAAGAPAVAAGDQGPLTVRVIEGPSTPWESLTKVLGPLLSWLGTAALVFLFVLFILLQRDDLRDRVIRLIGQNRIKVTTEALDEAGSRVSRYLLMQLIVNLTYGVPVAVGLYFIGLPNALLWGVLATILRFIPYLGPWIASSIPIILSIAVFDDWTHMFMTIGLYVVIELISNNFMEPMLYGHTTGVSPVAIIASAVFWTWLWGPVGLLLSMPLTVCLLVAGRYVPQMAFLNVLLGDQPVLATEARLYNRLLADDQDDALAIAEERLEETKSLVDLYDAVLVPALGMAERDRHDGDLTPEKQKLVFTGVAEMVEFFADKSDAAGAKKATDETETTPGVDTQARIDLALANLPSKKILCLPARDNADELAASMLAQILVRAHHQVRVVSVETLAGEMVNQVREFEPDVVCISALPPLATTHARYLAKRVKTEVPNARVIVGLWNAEGDSTEANKRLQGSGVDVVVKSIQEAVTKV